LGTEEAHLRSSFSPFGEVLHIRMRGNGTAFVLFKHREAVERILHSRHHVRVKGCLVAVDRARSSRSYPREEEHQAFRNFTLFAQFPRERERSLQPVEHEEGLIAEESKETIVATSNNPHVPREGLTSEDNEDNLSASSEDKHVYNKTSENEGIESVGIEANIIAVSEDNHGSLPTAVRAPTLPEPITVPIVVEPNVVDQTSHV